ncbi:MAG: mechanosensitive ion channel family protein [Candidatus Omnitrophica bacterium]|nr:mechanosensitive ion channel family protein [Candidatus Omnitrophota bacterium]MBU2043660.1 mechanosensitive ion channel family protein [Candidatus Omnitrophota bacterium]MBU2265644.1 mechanosensitive ion channel family protein [Candidatus Omnitrophota bacterium]MBU2473974.1 mechanosensitive ion channel family protein [Candidatus Omnitrophota bacterium]
MSKISKKVSWEIIKKILFPACLFCLSLTVYLFYRLKLSFYISPALQQAIKRYSLTLFILIIAFIIQRVAGAIAGWYKGNIASKTKTPLDDELIPLARRLLNIIIWVIALLVILPLYGINISALIATLGISSLAIALAAQDTIANIISGFLIMIDKPFRPGDRIKLASGEIVEVLEIGIRRSKFLSEERAIIIMPNVDLSKSKIINYTYGEERNIHGI